MNDKHAQRRFAKVDQRFDHRCSVEVMQAMSDDSFTAEQGDFGDIVLARPHLMWPACILPQNLFIAGGHFF